jgi:hypothetical protein
MERGKQMNQISVRNARHWIASLALSATVISPATAQIGSAIGQLASASADQAVEGGCAVRSIGAFPDRVHILCIVGGSGGVSFGGIGAGVGQSPGQQRYFAVENTVANNAMALTVLSVANAAIQQNRKVTIVYRTSASENPAGCQASDCRRIVGILLN